jgi:3-methyladenine DNA glycosylase AlkC
VADYGVDHWETSMRAQHELTQRFTAEYSIRDVLKDDASLYVRRSVANNLNDIGKDHPDLLVATCKRWMEQPTPERRWLIRHALRSAVKRGDAAALEILGFRSDESAEIHQVTIEPTRPRIGDTVRFSVVVGNTGERRAAFNIDLRVHFIKANGATSPKVFKIREVELDPGARITLSKSVSLQQQTTRTHHRGSHPVELVVNGATHSVGSFELT